MERQNFAGVLADFSVPYYVVIWLLKNRRFNWLAHLAATDTIYCIRNVHLNTIYGFCFIWLFSLFPKLGKEMGKLFGLNFVFRPVFLSVLPAIAGFFVLF